jgi:hypothetical protein
MNTSRGGHPSLGHPIRSQLNSANLSPILILLFLTRAVKCVSHRALIGYQPSDSSTKALDYNKNILN